MSGVLFTSIIHNKSGHTNKGKVGTVLIEGKNEAKATKFYTGRAEMIEVLDDFGFEFFMQNSILFNNRLRSMFF